MGCAGSSPIAAPGALLPHEEKGAETRARQTGGKRHGLAFSALPQEVLLENLLTFFSAGALCRFGEVRNNPTALVRFARAS